MRIQISVSDIQSKRFTKVAKSLRKRWHLEPLSLMQAQNLLATFLGYRDLHDLKSNLVILIAYKASEQAIYSRSSVCVSIAWDVSRRYPISFHAALALIESLSLKILDSDLLTKEYRSEVFEAEQRKAGRIMILDEFGYYMGGNRWFDGTPQLLAAGAPSNEFVILPNGRAIRWSKILSDIARLPEDLAQRLNLEPKYQAICGDFDRVVAFYRDEIMPGVSETAVEAIHASRQLAPGFELKGYGEDGLVLYNKALGGVMPVVYSSRSTKIFEDMVTLMTGGVIEHGGEGFIFGSDWMWHEAPGKCETRVDKGWCMGKFLTSELAPEVTGVARLMRERDHDYLRCYEWIDEQYIPAIIRDWFEFDQKPLDLNSAAIPAWHSKFQDRVDQVLNAKTFHAKEHLTDAFSDGRLVELIKSYAGASKSLDDDSLEAITHYNPQIPDYEPYNDSSSEEVAVHDEETLDEYRQDHDEAVEHYRQTGRDIASAIPALSNLGELTLGWLYYDSHDTYYQNSDAYLVDCFDIRRRDEVRSFLTFLCYHFHVVAAGGPASKASGTGNSAALQMTVDLVLQGICAPGDLDAQYMRIGNFMASARIQAKRILDIEVWRSQMADQASIAAGGEFLFAVNRVSGAKPDPEFAKIMREGRKYSVAPMMVTQDMSDFVKSDSGSGLSALFSQARSLGVSTVVAHQDKEIVSG